VSEYIETLALKTLFDCRNPYSIGSNYTFKKDITINLDFSAGV